MSDVLELNIQPQAGVIGVFSRLNYKPWYAIAEFVDNSTQSFYTHEKVLQANGIHSISIEIEYDEEEDILVISDDAFGMEFDDFSRAIKIDSPPDNKSGRNEFGMGLKTAASWFGEIWSVESSQFGSNKSYYAEINIPDLRQKNLNIIPINSRIVPEDIHGTKITIKQITKKIGSPRTKGKIVQLLESMYRRDLDNGKVSITFNGDPLQFDKYDCLTFRNKTWRKDLDFSFKFDGHSHRVKGFVGILANGGYGKAGFALFRRDRVVIGGEEMNYKPTEIFVQAQSTIAHKLFGELDLDDFPINQAKDGFVWDDGLEFEFITRLKSEISDYIKIAKLTNKERAKEEALSEEVSDTLHSEVEGSIQRINEQETSLFPQSNVEEQTTTEDDDEVSVFAQYQAEQNNAPEIIDEKVRVYKIMLDSLNKCEIKVQWTIGNSSSWINVDFSDDSKNATVRLNINHPFFKPFSEKPEFKTVLEKFAIAFVLSELKAKKLGNNDGLVMPSHFRTFINDYLQKLSDE